MKTLDFWYEFASTYSYLSVMRIEEAAKGAGVGVRWRPFMLGPIFAAQGWKTSPFNLFPAKGRYMVRDMERICAARGLPFALPEPFPQNGLNAARLALFGEDEGWIAAFSRFVYAAQFGDGKQLDDRAMLTECLESVGADPALCFERITHHDIKDGLRAQTDTAQALGIFGAPSFVTPDGELFWGDDRLEQALEWTAGLPRA
ncbi:MAG: 2-hydroxychromene-2-carboxylate isomerase [Pseudomonadota bacterium]|nr:2-hydroxychromene-2-carboxylate isomerase [Pseudomonadota bacterium]